MAGMTSAAAASSSIEDCDEAAVRLKYWRSRLRPPKNIAAPSTSRMLPMIEPTIEALTTSCSPAPEREEGDDELGRVAEGDVEQAADPGPERTASSSVARPMSAAVGMTPSAEAKNVTTAPAWTSSNTMAIGMKGTSRYGQPWLVMRNRRRSTEGG